MKMSGFLHQRALVTSGVTEGFIINNGIDSTSGATAIPLRCLHFHGKRVLAGSLDLNIFSFLFVVSVSICDLQN